MSSGTEQIVEDGIELGDVVGAQPFVFVDPLRNVGPCSCDIPSDFRPLTLAEYRAKHTCGSD